MRRALDTARRWRRRIVLALADQGAASVANFLITVLLAVWLPLEDFGRYVLIWSASLLIESAQVALVTDSMPATVARYGRRNRQRLDVAGFWVVVMYGAATSLAILATVPLAMAWWPQFVLPLLCLAAVNPALRLYIYLRRLCYIRGRQDAATAASVAYGTVLLGGVLVLTQAGGLSVPAVILLWGAANAIAVLIIARWGIACFRRTRAATVRWLMRQLWRSGRWLAGAAIGFWIATWGLFPIVAMVAGSEAAGLVRALQNLFTPIVQFNAALNLAILPRVADKVVVAGPRYARRFAIYATGTFTAIVVLYAGIVMLEAPRLLTLLYRKPEIAAAAHLLWPLGLAMILESARQGSSMALLSMNRTRMFFVSRVVGVAAFLGGIAVLARPMGMEGILWANVIAHAVGTGILIVEALNLKDSPAPPARAAPRAPQPLPTMPA
jgi:O-antigen/teichoic acid export membrane protein